METHSSSKGGRGKRLALVGAAAVLVGTATVGATSASWTDHADTAGGTITAGDLDISLAGDETVTAAHAGGAATTIDPASFKASSGDVVTFTQPMTTTLEGDNMSATLSTAWTNPASIPAGVTGTYKLVDADGTATTPETPIGTSVEVKNVPNEKSRPVDLVVTLDMKDADATWASDTSLSDATPIADFGTIKVNLDQVRTGAGFNR